MRPFAFWISTVRARMTASGLASRYLGATLRKKLSPFPYRDATDFHKLVKCSQSGFQLKLNAVLKIFNIVKVGPRVCSAPRNAETLPLKLIPTQGGKRDQRLIDWCGLKRGVQRCVMQRNAGFQHLQHGNFVASLEFRAAQAVLPRLQRKVAALNLVVAHFRCAVADNGIAVPIAKVALIARAIF